MKPQTLKSQNLFFYKAKNMQTEEEAEGNTDSIELLFHSIILAHCILYLTKILFELSLSISRITNFCEVANLGCMFVFVVTKYVEIFLKGN